MDKQNAIYVKGILIIHNKGVNSDTWYNMDESAKQYVK